jgi:HK97 gp10 family phage protein
MVDDVQVIGGEELKQKFLTIGDSVRDRLRRTMQDLGRQIADRAASLAPKGKTSELRGSIKPRMSENNNSIVERISPGAFYARFIEFGVVNHGSPNNRNLAPGKRGKVTRVRDLRTEGLYRIRPHPFMEPAFDGLEEHVRAELGAAMAEGVEEGKR